MWLCGYVAMWLSGHLTPQHTDSHHCTRPSWSRSLLWWSCSRFPKKCFKNAKSRLNIPSCSYEFPMIFPTRFTESKNHRNHRKSLESLFENPYLRNRTKSTRPYCFPPTHPQRDLRYLALLSSFMASNSGRGTRLRRSPSFGNGSRGHLEQQSKHEEGSA